MSDWNFATVWETVARELPDAPALTHEERRLNWRQFERAGESFAAVLRAHGLEPQAKVAQYLYNCPEYLISVFGSLKASMVPVNTNYRYTGEELVYLWLDADVRVVVFHSTFADRIDQIRDRLPGVQLWICVDDAMADMPDWALPFPSVDSPDDPVTGNPRSGDDVFMIYTGGTTGQPKGVMWRQDDLFVKVMKMGRAASVLDSDDLGAYSALLKEPGPVLCAAAPLMHGTGLMSTCAAMFLGGSLVTLPNRNFSATAVLDAVAAHRVTQMSIVGDTFARPILEALDGNPDRWDLSSLRLMFSSGVMWSHEVKAGLLRHLPGIMLTDGLGASETPGMGRAISSSKELGGTGRFKLGDDAVLITDDGRIVTSGVGEVGRLAVGGRLPIGYYKDPEKTAQTFVTVGGRRFAVPGDYAEITQDGTINLLGRGSSCINTGGEKVYPEEVEEAIKKFPGIADAAVAGVPDPKWGQSVVALVECRDAEVNHAALLEHLRNSLAGYKLPKQIFDVEAITRAPNGKLLRKVVQEEALKLTSGVS